MSIYKLRYTDKESAIKDLVDKGVYIEMLESLSFGQGIQAVVEIGLIVLIEATYDENGNEITPPIFDDGYYFDVMSDYEIDFGDKLVFPKNPKHTFAGYYE